MSIYSRILAGKAFVEISADSKKLSAGLNQAQQDLKKFRRAAALSMAAFSIPVKNAFDLFSKFDDSMRIIASTTGNVMKPAAHGINSINAELVRSNKTIEESVKDMKSLEATARELGRTTSYTAKQAADAMIVLARAGKSVAEINAMTESVLNLARATGTSTTESANIAIGVLNSFEVKINDVKRSIDMLTATANSSPQTLSNIGAAMRYIGPVANSMNITLEETLRDLSVLANFSLKGEQAGTALRNMYVRMASAANQVKIKEIFDVDLTDSFGNLRKLDDVLVDIKRSVDANNISMAKTANTLKDVFSIRSLPAAYAMIDGIETVRDGLNRVTNQSKNAAQQMDQGVGGGVRFLKSRIQEFGIAFIENFEKPIRKTLDAFTDIIDKGIELTKTLSPLVNVVTSLAVPIVKVGAAVVGIKALTLAFTALTGSASGFISLVKGGFTKVIEGIGFNKDHLKQAFGFRNIGKPTQQQKQQQINVSKIDSAREATRYLAENLRSASDQANRAITRFNKMSSSFEGTATSSKKLVKDVAELNVLMKGFAATSKTSVSSARDFQKAIRSSRQEVSQLCRVINTLKNRTEGISHNLLNISNRTDIMINAFGKGSTSLSNFESLMNVLHSACSNVNHSIYAIKTNIKNLSREIGNSSRNTTSINQKINNLSKYLRRIDASISNIVPLFSEFQRNITLISSAFSRLNEAVKPAATTMAEFQTHSRVASKAVNSLGDSFEKQYKVLGKYFSAIGKISAVYKQIVSDLSSVATLVNVKQPDIKLPKANTGVQSLKVAHYTLDTTDIDSYARAIKNLYSEMGTFANLVKQFNKQANIFVKILIGISKYADKDAASVLNLSKNITKLNLSFNNNIINGFIAGINSIGKSMFYVQEETLVLRKILNSVFRESLKFEKQSLGGNGLRGFSKRLGDFKKNTEYIITNESKFVGALFNISVAFDNLAASSDRFFRAMTSAKGAFVAINALANGTFKNGFYSPKQTKSKTVNKRKEAKDYVARQERLISERDRFINDRSVFDKNGNRISFNTQKANSVLRVAGNTTGLKSAEIRKMYINETYRKYLDKLTLPEKTYSQKQKEALARQQAFTSSGGFVSTRTDKIEKKRKELFEKAERARIRAENAFYEQAKLEDVFNKDINEKHTAKIVAGGDYVKADRELAAQNALHQTSFNQAKTDITNTGGNILPTELNQMITTPKKKIKIDFSFLNGNYIGSNPFVEFIKQQQAIFSVRNPEYKAELLKFDTEISKLTTSINKAVAERLNKYTKIAKTNAEIMKKDALITGTEDAINRNKTKWGTALTNFNALEMTRKIAVADTSKLHQEYLVNESRINTLTGPGPKGIQAQTNWRDSELLKKSKYETNLLGNRGDIQNVINSGVSNIPTGLMPRSLIRKLKFPKLSKTASELQAEQARKAQLASDYQQQKAVADNYNTVLIPQKLAEINDAKGFINSFQEAQKGNYVGTYGTELKKLMDDVTAAQNNLTNSSMYLQREAAIKEIDRLTKERPVLQKTFDYLDKKQKKQQNVLKTNQGKLRTYEGIKKIQDFYDEIESNKAEIKKLGTFTTTTNPDGSTLKEFSMFGSTRHAEIVGKLNYWSNEYDKYEKELTSIRYLTSEDNGYGYLNSDPYRNRKYREKNPKTGKYGKFFREQWLDTTVQRDKNARKYNELKDAIDKKNEDIKTAQKEIDDASEKIESNKTLQGTAGQSIKDYIDKKQIKGLSDTSTLSDLTTYLSKQGQRVKFGDGRFLKDVSSDDIKNALINLRDSKNKKDVDTIEKYRNELARRGELRSLYSSSVLLSKAGNAVVGGVKLNKLSDDDLTKLLEDSKKDTSDNGSKITEKYQKEFYRRGLHLTDKQKFYENIKQLESENSNLEKKVSGKKQYIDKVKDSLKKKMIEISKFTATSFDIGSSWGILNPNYIRVGEDGRAITSGINEKVERKLIEDAKKEIEDTKNKFEFDQSKKYLYEIGNGLTPTNPNWGSYLARQAEKYKKGYETVTKWLKEKAEKKARGLLARNEQILKTEIPAVEGSKGFDSQVYNDFLNSETYSNAYKAKGNQGIRDIINKRISNYRGLISRLIPSFVDTSKKRTRASLDLQQNQADLNTQRSNLVQIYLDPQIQANQQQLADAQNKLAAHRQVGQTKYDSLTKPTGRNKKTALDRMTEEYNKLLDDKRAAEIKLTSINNEINSSNKRILDLNDKILQNDAKLQQLIGKYRYNESLIKNSAKQARAYDREAKKLQGEKDSLEQRNKDIKTTLIPQANASVASIDSQMVVLKDEIERRQRVGTVLRGLLDKTNVEKTGLLNQRQNLFDQIKKDTTAINDLQTQKTNVENDRKNRVKAQLSGQRKWKTDKNGFNNLSFNDFTPEQQAAIKNYAGYFESVNTEATKAISGMSYSQSGDIKEIAKATHNFYLNEVRKINSAIATMPDGPFKTALIETRDKLMLKVQEWQTNIARYATIDTQKRGAERTFNTAATAKAEADKAYNDAVAAKASDKELARLAKIKDKTDDVYKDTKARYDAFNSSNPVGTTNPVIPPSSVPPTMSYYRLKFDAAEIRRQEDFIRKNNAYIDGYGNIVNLSESGKKTNLSSLETKRKSIEKSLSSMQKPGRFLATESEYALLRKDFEESRKFLKSLESIYSKGGSYTDKSGVVYSGKTLEELVKSAENAVTRDSNIFKTLIRPKFQYTAPLTDEIKQDFARDDNGKIKYDSNGNAIKENVLSRAGVGRRNVFAGTIGTTEETINPNKNKVERIITNRYNKFVQHDTLNNQSLNQIKAVREGIKTNKKDYEERIDTIKKAGLSKSLEEKLLREEKKAYFDRQRKLEAIEEKLLKEQSKEAKRYRSSVSKEEKTLRDSLKKAETSYQKRRDAIAKETKRDIKNGSVSEPFSEEFRKRLSTDTNANILKQELSRARSNLLAFKQSDFESGVLKDYSAAKQRQQEAQGNLGRTNEFIEATKNEQTKIAQSKQLLEASRKQASLERDFNKNKLTELRKAHEKEMNTFAGLSKPEEIKLKEKEIKDLELQIETRERLEKQYAENLTKINEQLTAVNDEMQKSQDTEEMLNKQAEEDKKESNNADEAMKEMEELVNSLGLKNKTKNVPAGTAFLNSAREARDQSVENLKKTLSGIKEKLNSLPKIITTPMNFVITGLKKVGAGFTALGKAMKTAIMKIPVLSTALKFLGKNAITAGIGVTAQAFATSLLNVAIKGLFGFLTQLASMTIMMTMMTVVMTVVEQITNLFKWIGGVVHRMFSSNARKDYELETRKKREEKESESQEEYQKQLEKRNTTEDKVTRLYEINNKKTKTRSDLQEASSILDDLKSEGVLSHNSKAVSIDYKAKELYVDYDQLQNALKNARKNTEIANEKYLDEKIKSLESYRKNYNSYGINEEDIFKTTNDIQEIIRTMKTSGQSINQKQIDRLKKNITDFEIISTKEGRENAADMAGSLIDSVEYAEKDFSYTGNYNPSEAFSNTVKAIENSGLKEQLRKFGFNPDEEKITGSLEDLVNKKEGLLISLNMQLDEATSYLEAATDEADKNKTIDHIKYLKKAIGQLNSSMSGFSKLEEMKFTDKLNGGYAAKFFEFKENITSAFNEINNEGRALLESQDPLNKDKLEKEKYLKSQELLLRTKSSEMSGADRKNIENNINKTKEEIAAIDKQIKENANNGVKEMKNTAQQTLREDVKKYLKNIKSTYISGISSIDAEFENKKTEQINAVRTYYSYLENFYKDRISAINEKIEKGNYSSKDELESLKKESEGYEKNIQNLEKEQQQEEIRVMRENREKSYIERMKYITGLRIGNVGFKYINEFTFDENDKEGRITENEIQFGKGGQVESDVNNRIKVINEDVKTLNEEIKTEKNEDLINEKKAKIGNLMKEKEKLINFLTEIPGLYEFGKAMTELESEHKKTKILSNILKAIEEIKSFGNEESGLAKIYEGVMDSYATNKDKLKTLQEERKRLLEKQKTTGLTDFEKIELKQLEDIPDNVSLGNAYDGILYKIKQKDADLSPKDFIKGKLGNIYTDDTEINKMLEKNKHDFEEEGANVTSLKNLIKIAEGDNETDKKKLDEAMKNNDENLVNEIKEKTEGRTRFIEGITEEIDSLVKKGKIGKRNIKNEATKRKILANAYKISKKYGDAFSGIEEDFFFSVFTAGITSDDIKRKKNGDIVLAKPGKFNKKQKDIFNRAERARKFSLDFVKKFEITEADSANEFNDVMYSLSSAGIEGLGENGYKMLADVQNKKEDLLKKIQEAKLKILNDKNLTKEKADSLIKRIDAAYQNSLKDMDAKLKFDQFTYGYNFETGFKNITDLLTGVLVEEQEYLNNLVKKLGIESNEIIRNANGEITGFKNKGKKEFGVIKANRAVKEDITKYDFNKERSDFAIEHGNFDNGSAQAIMDQDLFTSKIDIAASYWENYGNQYMADMLRNQAKQSEFMKAQLVYNQKLNELQIRRVQLQEAELNYQNAMRGNASVEMRQEAFNRYKEAYEALNNTNSEALDAYKNVWDKKKEANEAMNNQEDLNANTENSTRNKGTFNAWEAMSERNTTMMTVLRRSNDYLRDIRTNTESLADGYF